MSATPSVKDALPGEVWQDGDGCCLTPDPGEPGYWFAFGRTEPLRYHDLSEADRPVQRLLVQGGAIAPERIGGAA